MEINWRKTRDELPPKNSNENYAWITESQIIVHGYYDGKFKTCGTLNYESYTVMDVICWIPEDELIPNWIDKEQLYRTNNALNY